MTLPNVGDERGVDVKLQYDVTQQKNGRTPLCILLDAAALYHLALMAGEFFAKEDAVATDEQDEIASVGGDSDADTDEANDASSQVTNDDIGNVGPPTRPKNVMSQRHHRVSRALRTSNRLCSMHSCLVRDRESG